MITVRPFYHPRHITQQHWWQVLVDGVAVVITPRYPSHLVNE